jgi:tripartite-type tricarboxylate transporter receptor subunit TctC
MNLPRRKFLHLAAGASAALGTSRLAWAQPYPTRPVHLIVGFPPGGFVDFAARLIGPSLSDRLGQQFVVENKPGASMNIGTRIVVRAEPDGYTLLVASNANTYNATLYDNLDFNFIRDIAPIATVMRAPFVMTVNSSVSAKTIPEFIAYAKANPGKINMGTAGPGSAAALCGELFKVMADVDLVAVHYRGIGPALPDLLSGRVEVVFIPVAQVIGHISSGKLRPLGVTSIKRVDLLPDVPAIDEFLPSYEGVAWTGIGAPTNTPREIIVILNKEVNAALADPKFKANLAEFGAEPFAGSPAEFGNFIASETEKWGKVIRTANIKAE